MSEPDTANLPEQPNPDGLAAFAQRAGHEGDGPVTMLNLLALKPDGGRARYEQYGAAVAPLLERVGVRTEALTAGELHPLDTLGAAFDR